MKFGGQPRKLGSPCAYLERALQKLCLHGMGVVGYQLLVLRV